MGRTMSLQFQSDEHSKLILKNGQSRMNLVSLDAGESVETHRASVPATAIVLEGEIKFWAGDEEFNLKPGEVMLLEEREPHSLKAIKKSTIVVTRLANGPKESRHSNNKESDTKAENNIPECNH